MCPNSGKCLAYDADTNTALTEEQRIGMLRTSSLLDKAVGTLDTAPHDTVYANTKIN